MMAVEEATANLAAFGVAFAFAIIIESPVIMLMSASTALVEDAASFHALRRFAFGLAALVTGAQVVVLFPPSSTSSPARSSFRPKSPT